jgi:UDP-N-acetyl-D-galactosamine dehydrogenase
LTKFKNNPTTAIIGLGYVGLPLAVAFAEKYNLVGFDINEQRLKEPQGGKDHTLEVEYDLKEIQRELVYDVQGIFDNYIVDKRL